MKYNQKTLFIVVLLTIIGIGGIYLYQKFIQDIPNRPSVKDSLVAEKPEEEIVNNLEYPDKVEEQTQTSMQIANPASVNCSNLGGDLVIQKNGAGGEYGVCFFEDNRQCEEWALLRGLCPVDGLKITGYENEAEIYCVITGGEIEALNTDTPMCKRTDGTLCTAQTNFNGECPDPNNPTPNAGNTEVQ